MAGDVMKLSFNGKTAVYTLQNPMIPITLLAQLQKKIERAPVTQVCQILA